MFYSDHGCWIKIFDDNSKEKGTDIDIKAGTASWSRGRQTDIKEVLLFDGFLGLSLSVPDTKWYQFDRYISPVAVGQQKSLRTARAIQAEINSSHLDKYIIGSTKNSNMSWAIVSDDRKEHDLKIKVEEKHIGLWLTLVLLCQKSPIISLSNRGKI